MKGRPEWFSKEKCFENLLATRDQDTKVTVFFDGNPTKHFTTKYAVPILALMDGGSGAKGIRGLWIYLRHQQFAPDDIIYIVEDDFKHAPGWTNALREAFEKTPADYVTLYDHPDKYDDPNYTDLKSKVFVTPSAHWRTVPSTVNTIAFRFKTLVEDLDILVKWCSMGDFPYDHAKYIELGEKGRMILSPMPGYSTHCEPEFLGPRVDWAAF